MSLLQINTAIPLAEPLLDQQQHERDDDDERHISTTSAVDHPHHHQHQHQHEQHRIKFIALGALTGFFIQIVSLSSYAFLLIHYQTKQIGYEEDDASTTAALLSGFVKQDESSSQEASSSENVVMFGTETITYTILSVLTQVDLVVYVLIWIAFTCTMTRNGMACIRSQFFSSDGYCDDDDDEDDDEDDEDDDVVVVGREAGTTKSSHKDNKNVIKRRYVFILGVYFLVGIVSGAFSAWSAIDIYLGFPIPFQPILFTVTVDLFLCYFMVRCYDMGRNKNKNMNKNKNSNLNCYAVSNNDEDEEIKFSSIGGVDDDDDHDEYDNDNDRSSLWC